MLQAPFDVGVHDVAYTHFYFYSRVQGGRGGGEKIRDGFKTRGFFFFPGSVYERRWAWIKMLTVTPRSLSLQPLFLQFPGGLYGWKWGILSATSLTQTVPSALPQDQPEGREANDHWHGGSVPHWKATHSSGIPHGEWQPCVAAWFLPLAAINRHAIPTHCSVAAMFVVLFNVRQAFSSEPVVQSSFRTLMK